MNRLTPRQMPQETVTTRPSVSRQYRPPRASGLHTALIALQRAAGNAAASRVLSRGRLASIVQPVIGSAGVPLEASVRAFMEARLGDDFRDVSVHTDNQAAASARAVGALAYSVNSHLVFGAGRYTPATASGRELLAHELAHVAQSRGRAGPLRLGRADEAYEREANHAVSSELAGARHPISTGAPAAVRRIVDPQLDQYLRALESAAKDQAVVPRATEEVVPTLVSLLRGLNLADRDNLTPVTTTVAENFSTEVLTGFLEAIEARVPHSISPEQRRYEQTIRLLEPQRHGPYGVVGPGLMLPVMAGAMEPAVKPLMNAVGSGAAFFLGVFEGLGETIAQEDLDRLNTQLMKANILNTVFPVVFAAGAVAGVAQDIWSLLKLVYHVAVGDLGEWLATTKEVVGIMLSPEGTELALATGREIGRDFGAQIIEASHSNVFSLSFELGRLVGPFIVYAILAFLGVPEAIGAAIGERLVLVLGPLLENEPRLLALVMRLAERMGHVPRLEAPTADLPAPTTVTKLPGPTTVEEYVARGGKITRGPAAELPKPEPIKVGTVDETFAAKKSLVLGEEAEVEAIHPTDNPFGFEESNPKLRGKLLHKFSDRIEDMIKDVLVKKDAQATELLEKLGMKWPEGVEPNTTYSVIIKDGSKQIPDGIDWDNGIVYELKPRSPYGLKKGPRQLEDYVRYMNEYDPRKGGPWRGELLFYEPSAADELLTKWGYLAPKAPKLPKTTKKKPVTSKKLKSSKP